MKHPPTPEPVIVVDTREPCEANDIETALFRPSIVVKREVFALDTIRRKLDVGDYSLPGLEHLVTIERKTLGDLWSTLFGDRTTALGDRAANLDRFRAELERARPLAFKRIVVEASRSHVEHLSRGVSILAMLDAFEVDYGVPVAWCDSRIGAEVYVGTTLARIWNQHHGGDKWRAAVERGYAGALPWRPPCPTPPADLDAVAEALGS